MIGHTYWLGLERHMSAWHPVGPALGDGICRVPDLLLAQQEGAVIDQPASQWDSRPEDAKQTYIQVLGSRDQRALWPSPEQRLHTLWS